MSTLRGTCSTFLASLISSQPSGSISRFARKKMMKTA